MTTRNLQYLFAPKSVAVIGSSADPQSSAGRLLRNLRGAAFAGPISTIDPSRRAGEGSANHASIAAMPGAPDLAVLCAPAASLPALIAELGARGTRAAIVVTQPEEACDPCASGAEMLDAAKPHGLRLLGCGCPGLVVPEYRLNASLSRQQAAPGTLAFVSQSATLLNVVVDWSKSREIGFSKLVCLGDSVDVDIGDVIDYLASDEKTHAILLYLESVGDARKFMSAARAAARNKPVLVVRAGRSPQQPGAEAALAASRIDDAYDAAIRRAGMLRVGSLEALLDTVENLAHPRRLHGERLAILSNGRAPALMAADELASLRGPLARLSAQTRQATQRLHAAEQGNCLLLRRNATVRCYVEALEALDQDGEVDAILMIHAPDETVPAAQVATAVAQVASRSTRKIIACWLGGDDATAARRLSAHAHVASFATPEEAVHAFMQDVQYWRNQALLMEVPSSLPQDFAADAGQARAIIQAAQAAGRAQLDPCEARCVLGAYGIACVETALAATAEAASQCARRLGFPLALKILSGDVRRKSDVGGVALDLEDDRALRLAAASMLERVQSLQPAAAVEGFIVQTMARRPQAHELIIEAHEDPVFGPVVAFGQGGTSADIVADRATGLVPLNRVLARELVGRTRVSKLLAGYGDCAPANVDAICRTLVQVSHLLTDLPDIVGLEINPLSADRHGVLALDARIRLAAPGRARPQRCCIRPYPAELEESIEWNGQRIVVRPIRPEDGPQHVEFFQSLDPVDVHYRMFMMMRELQLSQLARFTQIDYDREMAFIASRELRDGSSQTLGVARAVANPDNSSAEFAIIVRSDLKGGGLGPLLMNKLIGYLRSRGTGEVVGEALGDNHRLLALVRRLGFEIRAVPGTGTVALRMPLEPPTGGKQRAAALVTT